MDVPGLHVVLHVRTSRPLRSNREPLQKTIVRRRDNRCRTSVRHGLTSNESTSSLSRTEISHHAHYFSAARESGSSNFVTSRPPKLLTTKEERGSKEQPSPETVGRELEGQLLFGEHAAKDVASAASATASSRIQAGFIVVNLPDSSTSSGMPRASADLPSDILKALEGAAWAQRATAAPLVIVCSHFVRWRHIESALAIATAHWASEPTSRLNSKVIVAGMHGGISQSLQDQVAILERGAVLCFDCFGRVEWLSGPEYYPSDEESSVRIAELVRQGFADQVVISQWVSRRIHLSRFVIARVSDV